jgi:hypothetical protein
MKPRHEEIVIENLILVHAHVCWIDPATHSEWENKDDASELPLAVNYSVGFVLPDSGDECVRLAMTQNVREVVDVLVIPKSLILRIRKVKTEEP